MKKLLVFILFFGLLPNSQAQQPHPRSGPRADLAPFLHGVASGDPLSDRLIIWTRLTTDSVSALVSWRIATDTAMLNVVDSGQILTDASSDYTVKIDVLGLQPNSYYYYEFEHQGRLSLRGRSRTLPVGNVGNVRFAAVSCANYEGGYFNVYNSLAQRNDIDAVLHLGDYIYEYGNGLNSVRATYPSYEVLNLEDYRLRYSYYKLDEDLIRAHQQHPFICIWDDHETANDSWYGGAQNHDPNTEGDWFDRKGAATKAYFEWLPIRRPMQRDSQRIYRDFKWGNLVHLMMLDTRLEGREQQNGVDLNPSRTLLGQQQFEWLNQKLSESASSWNIIAQQVIMAHFYRPSIPGGWVGYLYRGDGWDGYSAERGRLYDSILQKNIENVVVLTGDFHSAWGSDLPSSQYSPIDQSGSVGVEFITNSISSPHHYPPASLPDMFRVNPHIKFAQIEGHGYTLIDINEQRSQCDWRSVGNASSPVYTDDFVDSWWVQRQERHLRHSGHSSLFDPSRFGAQAPLEVRNGVNTSIEHSSPLIISAYPNPCQDYIWLQYQSDGGLVSVELIHPNGQICLQKNWGQQAAGVQNQRLELPQLAAGCYGLKLQIGGKIHTKRIIIGKN